MMSLTFKNKMRLLLAVAMFPIFIGLLVSGLEKRRILIDARRDQLVTAVQSAAEIVRGFQARANAGKMSLDEAQNAASVAVGLARFGGDDGKTNYTAIFDLDGINIVHPIKPEWKGKMMIGKVIDSKGHDIIKDQLDALAASHDGKAFTEIWFPRPGQTEAVPKLMYMVKIDGWNWMISSGLYIDDVTAEVQHQFLIEGVQLLLMLLLVGGTGWIISRSVQRQVGGEPAVAHHVMSEVSGGNLVVQLPGTPVGSMLHALASMVASLRQTVTQVRQSADSIATGSGQIAQGNLDLSQRIEEQASNLEETAASMEQLGSTVRQNADNAKHANQLAQGASEVARKGGIVVNQVVDTMQGINDSSKKIADIISVIDGIAFQTNILALNAAVEAARAGEQGRGFAVVASEVRSLAQRSAAAAKEIKTLISDSVERVAQGTQLVDQAGVTMSEIVNAIKGVTDIMGEISSASVEQSAGVAQVGEAITQMDQVTQQNAALVEQTAGAAESLKVQAEVLVQAMAMFRLYDNESGQVRPVQPPPLHARRGAQGEQLVRTVLKTKPAVAAVPVASKTSRSDVESWETF